MCGRYQLASDLKDGWLREQMEKAFSLSQRLNVNMKIEGEIRPTDIAPVLAPSSLHRTMGAFPMQWGFTHPTRGMLVFNTRMETAPEKDLFVGSVDDRRCLIPASCYYEWKKLDANRKQRYAFCGEQDEPLFLAGLYIRTSDVHRLPCFTILTQDAEKSIRGIHPRMPVPVPLSRAEEWLSPDTDFHELIYSLNVPLTAKAD